jgi:branched-chain amino acid transport system permease protein
LPERRVPRLPTSHGIGVGAVLAVLVVLLADQLASSSFTWEQILLIGTAFAVAASAWGLFAGFGGQFSFGHAALFGLPAYGAYLGNHYWDVPPLIGLVVSSLVLPAAALLLVGPAFRLRGPYFALVTLAVAEIARRLVNATPDVTGGEDGVLLSSGTKTGLLYLEDPAQKTYVIWLAGLLGITVTVFWVFLRTRTGRELTAVRDEEDIARSTGVNVTVVKMIAFVISGFFIGLAGGVYAYSSHIIASESLLGAAVSTAILVYAGVGGMRSLFGPVIGAYILVAAEQQFRDLLGADSPALYPMMYAAVFGVLLYFAPQGLVGLWHKVLQWLPWSPRVAMFTGTSPPHQVAAVKESTVAPRDEPIATVLSEEVRELLDELLPLERRKMAQSGEGLVVAGLTKSFGGIVVNHEISFDVGPHESIGIWGPNGSGKSTLINLLGGQLRPTAGTIFFAGERVDGLTPNRRAWRGVVRASQQARLYEGQSVLDNLLTTLFSTKRLNPLRGSDYRRGVELVEQSLRAVGLPTAKLYAMANTLSTGQRKRLEIARLLVGHRPQLILLDEPTAGIDRSGIGVLSEVLRAVHLGTQSAFIVVDHDQAFLRSVAPSVMCLGGGKVVDILRSDAASFDERLNRAVVSPAAEPVEVEQ